MSGSSTGSRRNVYYWSAWAGVIGVMIAGVQLCVSFDRGAGELVDRAVVGTWEIQVGQSHWIQTIRADGTFSFTASGAGSPPPQEGTFRAQDGAWSISSPAINWVDGGSYRLPAPNTLELQGKLGTGVWTRRR